LTIARMMIVSISAIVALIVVIVAGEAFWQK
jgi:hypothetical protein